MTTLRRLPAKRYATGFNQPVGIHIDEEGIRARPLSTSILHDSNGDEEVDYYEKYANDFGALTEATRIPSGFIEPMVPFISFSTPIYFCTGNNRTTDIIAFGVRNCMGVGGSKDYFWLSPMGEPTPASAIIEVNQSEHYGNSNEKENISLPLCYASPGG